MKERKKLEHVVAVGVVFREIQILQVGTSCDENDEDD